MRGLDEKNAEVPAVSHIPRSHVNLHISRQALPAFRDNFLDFLFHVLLSDLNMLSYCRNLQVKGHGISHNGFGWAAVTSSPKPLSGSEERGFVLLSRHASRVTCCSAPCLIPAPGRRVQLPPEHRVSSGAEKSSFPNSKLALQPAARQLCTLPPTSHWPQQVTWLLLTSTKRR